MSNRLLERPQTHITVNGRDYPLDTSYKAALYARNILEMVSLDGLDPLTASYAVIDLMLGLDSSENNMTMSEINEAVKGIVEYINKYAKTHDSDKKNDKPPILDFEYDAQLIIDAFMKMGIDLDVQDITYPRFMSLLRELPDDCTLCRIMYLRQLVQSGKINEKEYRNEKAECSRRGWGVIKVWDKRKQKQKQNDNDDFDEW